MKSNIEKQIIELYNSKEKIKQGYYLRVRKKGETNDIIAYYNGFKIFQIKDENFLLDIATFLPNSKNVYEKGKFIEKYEKMPIYVKEDINTIDKYFDFEIGSYDKVDKTKKLKIEFSKTFTDCSIKEKEEIYEKIKEYFDDCNNIINSIEKTDDKIVIELKNNGKITLSDLYSFVIKLYYGILNKFVNKDNKRYFKAAKLNTKTIIKNNKKLSLEEIEEIEKAVKRRTDVYAGFYEDYDYKESKSDTNQEKQQQQSFMSFINNNRNKTDILYKDKKGENKVLYPKNIYPFEMEYTIYAGKKENESDNNDIIIGDKEKNKIGTIINGRIDNILVEGDTIDLVEIKYGTGVIDKTNGIHKHLIDLYTCLNINKKTILNNFEKYVKDRKEILDNDKDVKIKNIKYDIICIYNSNADKDDNLSKNSVMEKIKSIYKENCNNPKIGMKIPQTKKCNCNSTKEDTCKEIDKYCKNLLDYDIPHLIKKIEKLGCPVKIILVDNNFKEFKEFNYK